jgi:hypothetical protein
METTLLARRAQPFTSRREFLGTAGAATLALAPLPAVAAGTIRLPLPGGPDERSILHYAISGCARTADMTYERTFNSKSTPYWGTHKTKAPRKPGRSQISTALRASGRDLGRFDLQKLAGARDWDRPRLHRLRNLAHEVNV